MGNVGPALCFSRVLCVHPMDTPTLPRWGFTLPSSLFNSYSHLPRSKYTSLSFSKCVIFFSVSQLILVIHNSVCFLPRKGGQDWYKKYNSTWRAAEAHNLCYRYWKLWILFSLYLDRWYFNYPHLSPFYSSVPCLCSASSLPHFTMTPVMQVTENRVSYAFRINSAHDFTRQTAVHFRSIPEAALSSAPKRIHAYFWQKPNQAARSSLSQAGSQKQEKRETREKPRRLWVTFHFTKQTK